MVGAEKGEKKKIERVSESEENKEGSRRKKKKTGKPFCAAVCCCTNEASCLAEKLSCL